MRTPSRSASTSEGRFLNCAGEPTPGAECRRRRRNAHVAAGRSTSLPCSSALHRRACAAHRRPRAEAPTPRLVSQNSRRALCGAGAAALSRIALAYIGARAAYLRLGNLPRLMNHVCFPKHRRMLSRGADIAPQAASSPPPPLAAPAAVLSARYICSSCGSADAGGDAAGPAFVHPTTLSSIS